MARDQDAEAYRRPHPKGEGEVLGRSANEHIGGLESD